MKRVALPLAVLFVCLVACVGAGSDSSHSSQEQTEAEMKEQVYTHALWRVKPGNEEAFIEKWVAVGEAFSNLEEPPLWGTLLRSATEPNVFYSFGPWRTAADIDRMRDDKTAQAALSELVQLCEEATPGMYHVVKHVDVKGR